MEALSPHFQVEELGYKCPRPSKFSWAFLNYLEVKDCIFVPWMPISEAHEAMSRMTELFPDKKVRHIGPFEDIVHMGGALHCVSWNILADPAPKLQEEA
jgi:agmatine/peptidylarginine deiminase